jgi:hypothetical protein
MTCAFLSIRNSVSARPNVHPISGKRRILARPDSVRNYVLATGHGTATYSSCSTFR